MEDYPASKVSVSLRNAISVNNRKTHALGKHVKTLEAERDVHLLNLKIKKDEVRFASPKTKKKLLKSTNVSGSSPAASLRESLEPMSCVGGSKRGENSVGSDQGHALPPLQWDRVSVIATPPRMRKLTNLNQFTSPGFSTPKSPFNSPEESPRTERLARPSSLPLMRSCSSLKDVALCEETLECEQPLSPRLIKPGTITTKLDLCQNPPTLPKRPFTAFMRRSGESEAHRGLILRPVASSKEQTKSKDAVKKANVFQRLYTGTKKCDSIKQRCNVEAPFSPKLERRRRRSVSLPDLSEMLNNLKTCRYLRDISIGED